MKKILRIVAGLCFIFLAVGFIAYLLMLPPNYINELKKAADTSIWNKQPKPRLILLKGVIVVNTKSGSLAKNKNILIANGRISRIVPADSLLADPTIQVINAEDKYVVPGFLDMHVHLLDSEEPAIPLALMLVNGITGFRQMSGSAELLALRREKGLPFLDQQPTLLGMPGPVLTPLNTHNQQEVIKNVRQQKAQGADFIKIGLLSPALFFAVLSEAKRIGIPALGHVPGDIDLTAASKAGIRSIEHLGLNYGALVSASSQETILRSKAPKILPLLGRLPRFIDNIASTLLENSLINPSIGTKPAEYERIKEMIASFSEQKAKQLAATYVANQTWQYPTIIHLRNYQLAFLPEVQNDAYGVPN